MRSGLLRNATLTDFLIACVLLLALAFMVTPASAQASYTPIQPTHWGNWYTPAASGEGIELSVIDDGESSPLVFANLYLLTPAPRWASAQGVVADAWRPDLGEYEFTVFQRPAVGAPAASIGSLWLRPNPFGQVRWRVQISDPLVFRDALLSQLTMPVPGVIGRCGPVSSFPAPPAADPRFCHD